MYQPNQGYQKDNRLSANGTQTFILLAALFGLLHSVVKF